MTYWPMA